MEKTLLAIICSGILLLVVAFSLAVPSIKSGNSSVEETTLKRLMHRPSPKHTPFTQRDAR
jgi:hypothetical protein